MKMWPMQVLATVRDKYGGTADEPPRTAAGGSQRRRRFLESEVKRDLHICVCLLNELKSHVVDDASLKTLQPQIFVPVHCDARDTLKLAPLLECSYCDDEWLRQGAIHRRFVSLLGPSVAPPICVDQSFF